MSPEDRWVHALEAPAADFFTAFAERLQGEGGAEGVVREALKQLVPAIAWEAYLPHHPHGVLGLRAVFRLRPLLSTPSFLRLLGTQLHMAATEGRREPAELARVRAGKGEGSRRNLASYVERRRPALAYAEAQGVPQPEAADFAWLGSLVAHDMANVGHKAVLCDHLGDLHLRLGRPRATGRRLLGLAAWTAATPEDSFWARRAAKRLGSEPTPMPWSPCSLSPTEVAAQVRVVCDAGLVELLDAMAAWIRGGQGALDTLAVLVRATAEKLLDARRDLEGKTAWTLVYLATLARNRTVNPVTWCQAAALVNLFPTDEAEGRIQAVRVVEPTAEALLDALLDSEPAPAMGHAGGLAEAGEGEAVLAACAEASSRNDSTFNHAHHVLAVAAVADLLPCLELETARVLLVALAKSLANSQGSGDLGRQADRALGSQGA